MMPHSNPTFFFTLRTRYALSLTQYLKNNFIVCDPTNIHPCNFTSYPSNNTKSSLHFKMDEIFTPLRDLSTATSNHKIKIRAIRCWTDDSEVFNLLLLDSKVFDSEKLFFNILGNKPFMQILLVQCILTLMFAN